MGNKVAKIGAFTIGFIVLTLVVLYSLLSNAQHSFDATPNTFIFALVLMFLKQLLFALPLFLLIVLSLKASRTKRIIIIFVLSTIFFSLNFGNYYSEWHTFIASYKYPNATNIHYIKSGGSGFDDTPYRIIESETTDSPKEVEEYFVKNIPPNYRLEENRAINENHSYVNYLNINRNIGESISAFRIQSSPTKVRIKAIGT